MLEWAKMNLSTHIGLPATAVPPPSPSPPLPPVLGVSMSPNQSVENVGTFGSSVGVETPEETLSRIAYGGFGGPVNVSTNDSANKFGGSENATTSGGGNYSPPQDDFPLY